MDTVDPAYAVKGSWLMCLNTLLKIRQLKASTGGSYLFPAEVDSTGTPLLCGRPVLICPTMPAMAASQKSIAFGDVSQFYRREVVDSLRLMVAGERWIEAGQIGYQSTFRCDGALAKSANVSGPGSPIQIITMKS